jgi:hypothetical protein
MTDGKFVTNAYVGPPYTKIHEIPANLSNGTRLSFFRDIRYQLRQCDLPALKVSWKYLTEEKDKIRY